MRARREGDHFVLVVGGQRFVARRRLDQGRGFALVAWWGGFAGNCDSLEECARLAERVAAQTSAMRAPATRSETR